MISQLTRVLAFILALLLLPVFSFAEETAAYTVEGIAYPYLQCMDDAEEPTESEMTLYFVNGGDIPYVKLPEYMACSGGGSCVVLPCTSASGAIFAISGPKQLATVRNGSFYNIDEGIDPDFILSRPESYYDRPALVEYIHSLK